MISVRDRLLAAATNNNVAAAQKLLPELKAEGAVWYNECMFEAASNNCPEILRIARMHSVGSEEQSVLLIAVEKNHWDCVKVLAEYVSWHLLPRYEQRIQEKFPHAHKILDEILHDPSVLIARLRNEAQDNLRKNVTHAQYVITPVINDEERLSELLGRFSQDIHYEVLIRAAFHGTPATIDLVLGRTIPAGIRQAAEEVRGMLMRSQKSFDVDSVQYFLSRADHMLLSQEVSLENAPPRLRKL